MTLQERIDEADPREILELEFNEYFESIVIAKPLTVEGNGSILCAREGPVVHIKSDRVFLKNLRIEITEPQQTGRKALALSVADSVSTEMQNITVKGNVEGVPNESGNWMYPDALHIWPIVPEQANTFTFDMQIPVSCVLSAPDLESVRIENRELQMPGAHRIRLTVEAIPENTILFGRIEIRSTYLYRIIPVSGGTFGVSSQTQPADPKKPVHIGPDFQEKIPIARPKRPFPFKYAALVMGMVLLAAAIGLFLNRKSGFQPPATSQVDSSTTLTTTTVEDSATTTVSTSNPTQDTVDPNGSVEGLKKSYRKDETVAVRIEAQDNAALKQIRFWIPGSSVSNKWEVDDATVSVAFSFPADSLEIGDHNYDLYVTDQAGNRITRTGSFTVLDIEYGYVNFFTKPWTYVYFNGKRLGATPLAKIKLPAGDIVITFKNDEEGINESKTIRVKPNELTRERHTW